MGSGDAGEEERMARDETSILGGPQPFPGTSWSLIRLAQDPNAPAYRASLEILFRKYWGPVYFFIRRNWCCDVEQAKDLTQAFFLAFLEKDFLASVSADKGRFRNFVCVALTHFLSKEKRAEKARKRHPGSGALLSLDSLGVEEGTFDLPDRRGDPVAQFHEDWKRAVIDAVIAELRAQGERDGKGGVVRAFIEYDLDRPAGTKVTYEDLALRHGLTVSQVTNGLHWARKEFRALFRRELEGQVATPEDLAAEARELFGMKIDG